MAKPSPKHSTAHAPGRPGQEPQAPAEKHLLDDELVHVPRGIPRWQFLLMIGLMIILLVTFLIPGAIMGVFRGPEERNPVAVRFELPGGSTVEWRGSDVVTAERALQNALQFDGFLAFQLGVDIRSPQPEDLVRLLVLDRLALESGVEITDDDLRAHLSEVLEFNRSTSEDFKNAIRAQGWDVRGVEESIRRLLRVARFQQLVGFAGAVPDPAKIEESWHEENVELAFDYVALVVESLAEEARKELPDDAGLLAWFEQLSEDEREELKTPETRRAELALFRDAASTPAAELVAAYPERPAEGAEPTAPEELGHQYYNRTFHLRFAKAREDGATGPQEFFPFEEVEDRCVAEGAVYFALQRWIEDLNARSTNGETIDLAAEAARLGLEHQALPEPLAREELEQAEGTGSKQLAGAVFSGAPDGSFLFSPVVLPQGIAVVRVNERVEPQVQPFEAVREKVVEQWLEPKSEELARSRLAALREGLEGFEAPREEGEEVLRPAAQKSHFRATAEAFRDAAAQAGLEVRTRDYLNKAGPANKDPQWEEGEHKTLFSQAATFGLYQLEPDEVAEPGVSFDKQKVYLVRLAGKREVPIANMSPTQYDRYKRQVRTRAVAEIGEAMDLDFLRKNFGLWLYEDSSEARARAAANVPTDDE